MKRGYTSFTILLALLLLPLGARADWTFPLTISSGGIRTNLTMGIAAGASNGYDQGLDSPSPFEGETLYAYFPHTGLRVYVAGSSVDKLYRDMRGSLPQEFYFEIKTSLSPVTIAWNQGSIPDKMTFLLRNTATGAELNMKEKGSYSFTPISSITGVKVQVAQGDLEPPSAPSGIRIIEKETSLAVTWEASTDPDLAGYKIHFGTGSGQYARTVDIRNVNNYNLFNLSKDTVYYVAVTAYDTSGNESAFSSEVSGSLVAAIDTVATSATVVDNSEATTEQTGSQSTAAEVTSITDVASTSQATSLSSTTVTAAATASGQNVNSNQNSNSNKTGIVQLTGLTVSPYVFESASADAGKKKDAASPVSTPRPSYKEPVRVDPPSDTPSPNADSVSAPDKTSPPDEKQKSEGEAKREAEKASPVATDSPVLKNGDSGEKSVIKSTTGLSSFKSSKVKHKTKKLKARKKRGIRKVTKKSAATWSAVRK
ncbi:MAG: fibronectin type III domain-containing protein [Geobacter sp.]|nr:fibronectin type III domain-containing protein [Geobacter sp.]